MRLTISIPTYNRNETLLRNLARLMPQLTKDCKLQLIDNCSDVPVEGTVREILAQYPDICCEVIRNRTNIGANANITRCLELCDTEWLWIIGDDDTAEPEAISTIFRAIDAHPEAVYINFSCDDNRKQSYATRGLEELADKLDFSAMLPWISSSVRRTSAMLPNVKFGYQYAYSLMPHVAILLVTVGQEGLCYWSHEKLVVVERSEIPIEDQWSVINLALGHSVLFDLPLSSSVRENLAHKLLLTSMGPAIRFRLLLHQLLLLSAKQNDPQSVVYIYDQICRRSYYYNRSFLFRLRILMGRFSVSHPDLAIRLHKLVKRRELGAQGAQDRYERM